MKVEDRFVVAAPQERVWTLIRDPAVMGPCIPGCDAIEVLSPTSYRATVKVAVGPIKAAFNVVVEVTGETPPSEVLSTTRGEEGSRASMLTAVSVLRLSAAEGGTEVFYSSEASVVGRLGKFGLGIMQKKAKTLGQQFAEAFKARAEAAEAA